MINKKELRAQFAKEWEKHYNIQTLVDKGFRRQQCSKCNRYFWSQENRSICGDPSCIGYEFIGNAPSKQKLDYVDTWKKVERYFTRNGHGSVKPYPTVARWRDDLYFTIASINDFQPYVVSGELDPPANPLIVPQPCIRFSDISNVGISGRHYTNFVMIGQHAFNNDKTGLFYWKDEALLHDIEYLKTLGIDENEIVFQEDVWAGGGNFGPSMEYFVRGLELGNCVFMQYEVTDKGPRELKTKVIDMGAGLSRLCWITHGSPTSYEVVFGDVVARMKKQADIYLDEGLFLKYVKLAGALTIDEVEDIEAERDKVARQLSISKDELFSKLEPLQAIYATADHLLTFLFVTTDGMLPSNAGGGYNIRMILRRVFGFEEKFSLNFDYEEIIRGHANYLYPIFPTLRDGVESALAVLVEEKKKYVATKEKARGKVSSFLASSKKSGKIPLEELVVLYKSHGVPPEFITEMAKAEGMKIDIPADFYDYIREHDEMSKAEDDYLKKEQPESEPKPWVLAKKKLAAKVVSIPKTEVLYYTNMAEFKADVLEIFSDDRAVVLDRTAFYPEGGGQVSDSGKLGDATVLNVQNVSGVILHFVNDVGRFAKGQEVNGVVDLARRKQITRHHTATHLVNAACRAVLGRHIWQGGSYKDHEKAHLDVTHYKHISDEELRQIELLVNRYILDNRKVKTEVLARNIAEEIYGFGLYQGGAVPGKMLRVVTIDGIDSEACGGTHHMIENTGELGCFKIVKRESVQDGLERLTYKCGEPAIRFIQEKEALLQASANVLSVGDSELPAAVLRFFTEWKDQRKKLERMYEKFAVYEGKALVEESVKCGKPIFRIYDADFDLLKKIGLAVSTAEDGMVILLNTQGNIVTAAGKKATKNATQLLESAVAKLGGKGGGSGQFASGKVEKIAPLE